MLINTVLAVLLEVQTLEVCGAFQKFRLQISETFHVPMERLFFSSFFLSRSKLAISLVDQKSYVVAQESNKMEMKHFVQMERYYPFQQEKWSTFRLFREFSF